MKIIKGDAINGEACCNGSYGCCDILLQRHGCMTMTWSITLSLTHSFKTDGIKLTLKPLKKKTLIQPKQPHQKGC